MMDDILATGGSGGWPRQQSGLPAWCSAEVESCWVDTDLDVTGTCNAAPGVRVCVCVSSD